MYEISNKFTYRTKSEHQIPMADYIYRKRRGSSGTEAAAAAVDGEFTLDHALAARGYPEGFVGNLGCSAIMILDRHQLSHHISLLADGHIVVGETVHELTCFAIITKKQRE